MATGTRAWTATASAPSTSPPAGPAEVAPISVPASVSAISLMNPSLPGPWIQPRNEDGIGGDGSPLGDVRAACLGFGEAGGTDFGIGEGHAGQRPVAGRLGCLAAPPSATVSKAGASLASR